MNELTTSDEAFNIEARRLDQDTPADRIYDLILAVFESNVSEASKLYKKRPHREPDAGLIQNAAAWVQELVLPDMSQHDIAQRIKRWIIAEAGRQLTSSSEDPQTEQIQQFRPIYFM